MTKTVKYPSLEWIELVSQGWVTITVDYPTGLALMLAPNPWARHDEGVLAVETLTRFLEERRACS